MNGYSDRGGKPWYIPRLLTELGNFGMGDCAQENLDKLAGRAERGTIHGNGDER